VLHGARCKYRTQKVLKKSPSVTIAQLCRAISSQLRHVSTIGKKLITQQYISSTCSHNIVNFGPLAAEIGPVVWSTPANFNGFRVLTALLHGTPVLGVHSEVYKMFSDQIDRLYLFYDCRRRNRAKCNGARTQLFFIDDTQTSASTRTQSLILPLYL